MLRSLRLLTLLCAGCGAAQPSVRALPSSPARVPDTNSQNGTASAPRSDLLPLDASYADLVRSAAELEGSERAAGRCLLARSPEGFRLEAVLAAAVRPLPPPPDDLDEVLKSTERVELLGTWGRYGDGNGKLALVAFTASAPARNAVALILTDRGISLRGTSGSTGAPIDGLDQASVLRSLPSGEAAGTVFVTAEAGRSVRDVYALLDALTQHGSQVTLAVGLAPHTALPLPASATARATHCDDGLPATDAPEGSLSAADLRAGVAPLKERAPDCLLRGDARGAAGGKLTIAFRIAGNGHVQESCITRDELGDPGVATCVLELARGLSFPAPSGAGVLDLELPIVLRAAALGTPPGALRAVCSEGEQLP